MSGLHHPDSLPSHQHTGLAGQYKAFQGAHGLCSVFRKEAWTLLDQGMVAVAEDSMGKRDVQFVRLRHKTGKVVFFMNHHGPLPLNSGGRCGAASTAFNLLKAIVAHAKPGDAIILVGDFNANAASVTIKQLSQRLTKVFQGNFAGGIDNIFSNVNASAVVRKEILGSGGSDHDALVVVLKA